MTQHPHGLIDPELGPILNELEMGLRPTHRDESPLLRSLIPNGLPATFDGVLLTPDRQQSTPSGGIANVSGMAQRERLTFETIDFRHQG
jgi:hypothetical protein